MSERSVGSLAAPLERLAAFGADLGLAQVPPAVAELAKLKLLDSIACAYLGRDYTVTRHALQLSADFGAGPCTLLLDRRRLVAHDAAFTNAVAIHALLQDDVDLES